MATRSPVFSVGSRITPSRIWATLSPAASPRRAASPSPARLRTQAVGACQGANGLGRQPRPRQSKRRSPRTSKAPPSRPLGDRGDVSRFKRPSEQAAQRVDEVTGCRWRGASLVAAGDNIAALPLREARFAKRLHDSLEDVFALASRRQTQGAPALRYPILFDGPSECPVRRTFGASPPPFALAGRLIGGPELDRTELTRNTNARPVASPIVPDGRPIAIDFTVKVRGKFSRHGGTMGPMGGRVQRGLRSGRP